MSRSPSKSKAPKGLNQPEQPTEPTEARKRAAPVTQAERVSFAVRLLDASKVPPYRVRQRMICEQFGVAQSTAAEDIKKAAAVVAERMAELAPHYGGVIKQSLERVAIAAERAGKLEVASMTWFRLAKLFGLADESDEALAKRLSDTALESAIAAEMARRLDGLSLEQLRELLKRREAQEGQG